MGAREPETAMVRKILDAAQFSVRSLARGAGIHPEILWGWAAGRRSPTPDNIRQVISALQRKRDELDEAVEKLETFQAGRTD